MTTKFIPKSQRPMKPRDVGDYTLEKVIGNGAFGKVYLGRNKKTMERLAIKEFSNCSSKDLEEIIHEQKLLEQFGHENIVQLFEVFEQEGDLYFVMEFVDLGTVTSLLERGNGASGNGSGNGLGVSVGENDSGVLPEWLVKYFVSQVLDGLVYLHGMNIIHRDIKGNNILINRHGVVKLADFGVSAIADKNRKRFTVIGTPYWMSPEVFFSFSAERFSCQEREKGERKKREERIIDLIQVIEMSGHDSKSDIWGLGCVVLELLTGGPPFFDLDPMAACFNIIQSPHPPLPSDIAPDLKDFLLKCFDKSTASRPSAKELLTHRWLRNTLPKGHPQVLAYLNPPSLSSSVPCCSLPQSQSQPQFQSQSLSSSTGRNGVPSVQASSSFSARSSLSSHSPPLQPTPSPRSPLSFSSGNEGPKRERPSCKCCEQEAAESFICEVCKKVICGFCINRRKCHICAGRPQCPRNTGISPRTLSSPPPTLSSPPPRPARPARHSSTFAGTPQDKLLSKTPSMEEKGRSYTFSSAGEPPGLAPPGLESEQVRKRTPEPRRTSFDARAETKKSRRMTVESIGSFHFGGKKSEEKEKEKKKKKKKRNISPHQSPQQGSIASPRVGSMASPRGGSMASPRVGSMASPRVGSVASPRGTKVPPKTERGEMVERVGGGGPGERKKRPKGTDMFSAETSLHSFRACTFKRPTWCSNCKNFLWGLTHQGLKCLFCDEPLCKSCCAEREDECCLSRIAIVGTQNWID